MESGNSGHQHSLVLLNGEQSSNESKNRLAASYCAKCGEEVSMSTAYYKCEEEEKEEEKKCVYLAHKICGEAPSQINHPFHRDHPLRLQPPVLFSARACDLCKETCESLAYRCNLCDFVSHIKCALFIYNIAQNNIKELDRIVSTDQNDVQQYFQMSLSQCLVCWEPLENLPPIPPTNPKCCFSLHKKCADLPLQLNHERHSQHPLLLQFNADQGICCKVCRERESGPRGFLYCCLPCKYAVHVECASPSSLPVIEDRTSHPHPFMLLQRRIPFICDACGTRGRNWDAYICHTCNVMVHKKCISLPRIIKSRWHDHPLFHKYFLEEQETEHSKTWGDCVICHDEVDIDHGSYSCSDCKSIFHVNCVKKYGYEIISLENGC